MAPTLKELKIILDATVIVLVPCLKKIKHVGSLAECLWKQILYYAPAVLDSLTHAREVGEERRA